ncbi:MAG TPA: DNA topoisomerase IB [Vicinamibacterales bacterium]|nr:DNA topoisomerase IB [Vicinamibacterales bacterium]
MADTVALSPAPAVLDGVEAARAAGLRYVSDSRPGITRERRDDTFVYLRPNGDPVTDERDLERIRKLAIPPAWTEVWICPYPNGHLQATGRDAKRRKQYRYHPRWRNVRDETKYNRMVAFAEALPGIRARVDEDLQLKGLPRRKVLATVVRLLETTFIRVGNQEYARQNKSFGLTTLRDRHVQVEGSTVRFSFKGKAGKSHTVDLSDRRLATIIKRCQDLPGYELFQYVDEDGARQVVDSADVNEYLRELSGQDFTAKDFRTWAGTLLAALALDEFEAFDSEAQAKKNIVRAIEDVAKRLGNTPAISRKSYVHPAVLDAYVDGQTLRVYQERAEEVLRTGLPGLEPEEAAVLAFLRDRLAREIVEQKRSA